MTATTNDGFTQTTATGGETTIDFDFLIYGKDDIAFYETDTDGVITLLVRGTDYSIADAELLDPTGGEIVLDVGQYPAGATAGHKFTCISDIAETRSSDFQQGGDFFAQTLNTNLDRLTRVTQQLRRDVDRSARLKVDSLISSVTFTDDPQDGYGVVWDGVLGNFRNTAASLAVLETNAATVAANITAINTVATNIANVNTVAGISANVTTVAGISAAVTTVAGISAAVSAVAAVDTEVATVAGISADVTAVAAISAAVQAVAAIDTAVSAVAAVDSEVATLAPVAADIATLAPVAASITAVAAIDSDVTTVAAVAGDVTTCATNIAAIIAAPDYATEAYNWAQYPEDSLVPEGNMVDEYSAYHWAQKAADSASGTSAALSVFGVTGNATATRADIVAGTNHQVLRRSGTALAFGAVNLAQSAAVTGILPTANGGTSNGFFTVSGPATSAKTYTFPNASCTVLTTNAAVTVAQGGTGATDAATAFSNLKQAATDTATGVVEKATQAEVEAETADKYPDASLLRYHPGSCKSWVAFNGTGTLAVLASYNVTSVTDNNTGDYTVNIGNDMSSANYAVTGICRRSGAANGSDVHIKESTSPAAGSYNITTANGSGTNFDPAYVASCAFGDQ